LAEWIGIFLTSFSSIITNLLSGIIFFTVILSYPMNIATGHEVLVMLITAFVIFVLPYIAAWTIARIMILNELIKDFIRS